MGTLARNGLMKLNPSITKNILVDAMLYGKYIQFSEKDFWIMKYCRKSLQSNNDEP